MFSKLWWIWQLSPLSMAAMFLSALYNMNLVTDLNALVASDRITIHVVDTFSFIDQAVNNPAAFDLTDVTDACYTGKFTGVLQRLPSRQSRSHLRSRFF